MIPESDLWSLDLAAFSIASRQYESLLWRTTRSFQPWQTPRSSMITSRAMNDSKNKEPSLPAQRGFSY